MLVSMCVCVCACMWWDQAHLYVIMEQLIGYQGRWELFITPLSSSFLSLIHMLFLTRSLSFSLPIIPLSPWPTYEGRAADKYLDTIHWQTANTLTHTHQCKFACSHTLLLFWPTHYCGINGAHTSNNQSQQSTHHLFSDCFWAPFHDSLLVGITFTSTDLLQAKSFLGPNYSN